MGIFDSEKQHKDLLEKYNKLSKQVDTIEKKLKEQGERITVPITFTIGRDTHQDSIHYCGTHENLIQDGKGWEVLAEKVLPENLQTSLRDFMTEPKKDS